MFPAAIYNFRPMLAIAHSAWSEVKSCKLPTTARRRCPNATLSQLLQPEIEVDPRSHVGDDFAGTTCQQQGFTMQASSAVQPVQATNKINKRLFIPKLFI